MKKIVTYTSLALFLFGALGFILTTILTPFINSFDIELPLIGIQGVVNKNNKIFVGIGPYQRIQIYNLNGVYIGFKRVHDCSQNFYFKIDENGNPQATAYYAYNVAPSRFLCEGNTKFDIENSIPIRLRVSSNSNDVIIKQSIFRYLWFPLTLWIITAIGLMFFFFTNMKSLLDIVFMKADRQTKLKRLLKEILS